MALDSDVLRSRARAEAAKKAAEEALNQINIKSDSVNTSLETEKLKAMAELDVAKNRAIQDIQNLIGSSSVNPIIIDSNLVIGYADGDSIGIDFVRAIDNQDAQADLTYYLYMSTTDTLKGTVEEIEAQGTLVAQAKNVSTLEATALDLETSYNFNVIVEDLDGNKSKYAGVRSTTTDLTAPTVANGSLTISNVGASSATIAFAKASDNLTPITSLVYSLYRSTSNNISTVAECEVNGSKIAEATDVAVFNVAGLLSETQYYFNVVVRDTSGNKTAYAVSSLTTSAPAVGSFVSTNGSDFAINSTPTPFIGSNAYYGPNYMKIDAGAVREVLDQMQTIGMNLTRTWGFYDGPAQYANDISLQPSPGDFSTDFQYLDQFIAECKSRGIYVIISLVNYWEQLGGVQVYNGWAGDPEPATNRMRKFINGTQQQQWFKNYIVYLLNRTNSVTGVPYKDEEHIFAWEIGNELRNPTDYTSPAGAESGDELRNWYQEIAQFIKGIDPNHMVTTGEEGFDEGTPADYQSSLYSNTYVLRAQAGTSYLKNTAIPEIDFAQCHWYPDVFGLQRTFDGTAQQLADAQQDQQVFLEDHHTIANSLGKPVLIGEWGIEDWDSADNYARKTIGYQHFYSVVQNLNIESHLLWQYVPNFGAKWGEFGGNIAFPGRASDETLYNDMVNHLNTMLGTGDTTAPTVTDSTLTFTGINNTSIVVNFNKAVDDNTPQTGLRYRLYRSASNNMTTIADTKANGTFIKEETDVDNMQATGLAQNTSYYFQIICLDASGNELLYTSATETTANIVSDFTLMPFGDSLTNDSRGRVQLWNNLVGAGHTVDYVGSQSQTSSIPDPDHEGVGGRTIQDAVDVATGLMTTYDPDYVCLLIGTNDFAWYFDEPTTVLADTAQGIADRHKALVEQILNASPTGTTVIVCTIPPVSSSNIGQQGGDRAQLVTLLNEDIRQYVTTMRSLGSSVELADLEPLIDPATDLASDGVHLTASGYVDMGDAFYAGMDAALNATPDVTAPTVGDPTLSFSSVGHNSLAVNFNKATDENIAQSLIQYKLYRSATNNITTVADAEANGTLVDTQTDVASITATGLSASTTYYWQVVASDVAGNKLAYTSASQATNAQPVDSTAPTISDGTITASNITETGMDLSFVQATDNEDLQSELTYDIYTHPTSLGTIADVIAQATLQGSVTGQGTFSLTGLTAGTLYNIYIVVSDTAGNQALYSGSETTASGATPTLNTGHSLASSLTMYHDFYEESGIVVNDLASTNNIDLDYGYGGPCPWVTFDGQQCVELATATADVAAIADSADMQPSGDFSWILRLGYTETGSAISSIFDGGGNPNGISINQRQWNDEYGFRIGSQIAYISIPGLKNDNLLHTLGFTVNTSNPLDWTITVYLDGVAVATDVSLGEQTGVINNFDTHLWVGGGDYVSPDVRGAYSTWWNKIAHWHRALTAQEMADYHANPDLMLQ